MSDTVQNLFELGDAEIEVKRSKQKKLIEEFIQRYHKEHNVVLTYLRKLTVDDLSNKST